MCDTKGRGIHSGREKERERERRKRNKADREKRERIKREKEERAGKKKKENKERAHGKYQSCNHRSLLQAVHPSVHLVKSMGSDRDFYFIFRWHLPIQHHLPSEMTE